MCVCACGLHLGGPNRKGDPKKTSPAPETSPAQETSKKPIPQENLSRAGENDALTSQFQSAWTSGTTFGEKITGVQNIRFHTLVDNAMLGTLGDAKLLEKMGAWECHENECGYHIETERQSKSLPDGRD